MKNYLSFGMFALLFALTFGTVNSVQAIAGPEWLLDRPSVNNSQLVVSVAGTVEGTNQDISLKFFEIDLTSRPAHGGKTEQGLSPKSKLFATDSGAMPHKLEKADLLKAIQEQLIANVHSNDDYFEVIDFASDATITDRNGKVYFADKDGSVTLPIQPVQEFLLKGHVRVRPYKENQYKIKRNLLMWNILYSLLP